MWGFFKKIKTAKINREFSAIALAHIITSLFGAAFWLILAWILLPEDFGKVSYMIAASGLLASIVMIGSDSGLVTFIARNQMKIMSQLVSLVFIISVASAFLITILTNQSQISILLLFSVVFGMAYAEFLGHKLYYKAALILVGQKILQLVLGIGLYFILGINGVVYGYAVSYLIFGYRNILSLKGFRLEFSELKNQFKFLSHNYSSVMSRTLVLYSDKIIIAPLYGYQILGLYQIGAQFMLIVGILPTIISDYLLSQEASGIERKKIKTYAIIFSGVIVLLSFSLAPFIVKTFFPNFIASIDTIRIICFGIIPMTYSSITMTKLLGSQNSKPVMIGVIIFLTVQYSSIAIMGKIFGIEGLAAATVLGLSSQAFYFWLKNKKIIRKHD